MPDLVTVIDRMSLIGKESTLLSQTGQDCVDEITGCVNGYWRLTNCVIVRLVCNTQSINALHNISGGNP